MWSLPKIQQELKLLLKEDIEETIEQFEVYLTPNSNIHNDVLVLHGNIRDVFRDHYTRNVISRQEFKDEKENIRKGVLLAINRLRAKDLKEARHRLPAHIIPLQSHIEKITNFTEPHYQDYLFDEHLPYISRDTYAQIHEVSEDFITETYILNQLFHSSNFYKGVVIYGKGGIGKTRLMYELGRRTMNNGWKVWIIQKEITDFVAFSQFLNPQDKHVFLFDYLEENVAFNSSLHQEFKHIPESHLKLIVNCRNTFRSSSKFPHETFFLTVYLDTHPHSPQYVYQQFVVQKILQQVTHLEVERFANQKIKLVLAVFLKYLDRNQLIKESDVGFFKAYTNWIQRRLAISFKKSHFSKVPQEVCFLMMTLPLKGDARDRLESDHEQEVNLLEQDGWIEVNTEGKLVAFHDTMVDELVLLHAHNRIWFKKALHFAIKYNALENWLRALDRVKDKLHQMHAIPQIHRLMERKIDAFAPISYQLAISPLFDETKRMQLFSRHLSVFEDFIKTKDFIKPLAFSLNELSKGKRPPEQLRSVKKVLEIWLSFHPNFVHNRQIPTKHTSKILSTSIKAFGADFNKKYLQDYLAIPFIPDQACFVLVAWLKQRGDKKIIETYLKRFLSQKIAEENTQFVLKEWLHAGGELAFIQSYLKQFLDRCHQTEGMRLVLQAWMERGGDLSIIRPALEQYLQQFSTQIDSRYLMEKWLKLSTDSAFLKPHLCMWLSHYATTLKEAQYVFRAWLEHQQEPDFVQLYLAQHLTEHATHVDSRFVLQDWIKYKGQLLFIQPFLRAHLEHHGTAFYARYLLQTWLHKGGNVQWIQETILQYLAHHPNNENTRFILNAWLTNGGESSVVQVHYLHYLEHSPLKENTYYLLFYWWKADGALDLIYPYIDAWLAEYPQSKYAKTLRRISEDH